ncbi:MAG: YigZ family protein [Firmicutes bacterium]|uniref:YigZ family protein n=1 Tax=Candidatus Onthovivens merdipullorum TaxID=2840889 RepID=A0A9D9GU32_9BACL|nr:YigZ family protein [Candidatus Onthovivens merdipullorum]
MKFVISKEVSSYLEVEKSKFIGIGNYFKNPLEVNYFLEKLRKEHPKARHICYAYIIGNEKKFSDDGEPSGTAGKPILSILENNNLDYSAIFVIRYFGGTLLGSSRLLRTYLESAKEVINKAKLLKLEKVNLVKISISYPIYNSIKYLLNSLQFDIKNASFNDKIIIEFYMPLGFSLDSIKNKYFSDLNIVSITETMMMKE